MHIYVLDENFLKTRIVDDFTSLIWTERYSRPGDVQLSVEATETNSVLLREGTFLSLPDSDEIMLIETAEVNRGLLTVRGDSLLAFLRHRAFRQAEYHWMTSYPFADLRPAGIIQLMVQFAAATSHPGGALNESQMSDYGLDGPREVFTQLHPDDVLNLDTTSARITLDVPVGMLGDIIERIAEDYETGIRFFIKSANESGYRLAFEAYVGQDLTTGGSGSLVRFSPALGTLTDIRELRSLSRYANVAYAYASNLPEELQWASPRFPDPLFLRMGEAYVDGGDTATGFNRRVIMESVSDFNLDQFQRTDLATTRANILAFLDRKARDMLANYFLVKMVDGEIVPQSEFQFGRDYGLGDLVELQGLSGGLQRARVTEYIRSQDATGERSYPTITIVD